MKLVKIGGNKRGVIIPKVIIEKVLSWQLGELLDWNLTEDKKGIIITSKGFVDE